MMDRCRQIVVALFFMAGGCCYAQVNVVNQGTLISIRDGITVSISGDYRDKSGTVDFGQAPQDESLTLDAPVFLSGTLVIGGDILNNSTTGTTLIYEFENPIHQGKVILNGSGDQRIKGTAGSYFPNLIIDKAGGEVVLDTLVDIANVLTMTNGDLNLSENVLRFGQYGQIKNETAVNRIHGYPGHIEMARYELNTESDTTDFKGIGIGYKTTTQNFVNVYWQRHHAPDDFGVANGANALRVYRMATTTTATFPQMVFKYHQMEIDDAGLSEADLALYYSNDNGASWTKAESLVRGDSVIATGVHIAGNASNILALASGTCLSGYLPDVTISSSSHTINSGVINICDQEDLDISVPQIASNDYAWDTPAGVAVTSSFSVDDISYTSHTGNYTVDVRNIRGCEATAFVTVNVRDIPSAGMTISPDPASNALCFGNVIQFRDDPSAVDAPSTITGWAWDFGDVTGALSSLQDPQFTYTTDSIKTVKLQVTSNFGCVSPVFERKITIDTLPAPAFRITDGILTTAIDERCEDLDVRFLNQSRYRDYLGDSTVSLSYQWNFGDGNHSTDQHPVHQYLAAGEYTITLRTTAAVTLCYSDVSQDITIDPEPIPLFTPSIAASPIDEACEGVYITFSNESTMPDGTGMTYHWNFADGETSTVVSPVKQYTAPQLYDVVLTVTSVTHGCAEDVLVQLPIHPAPKGSFVINDPDICKDEQASITNSSTIASGTFTNEWNFGDGTVLIDNNQNVFHTYVNPQQYKVTLTRTSDEGCTNNISKIVVLHPDPVTSFIGVSACAGKEIIFYNNTDIQTDAVASYLWDFNDGTTSSLTAPTHIFPTHGNKNVSLTATSTFGCTNTFNGSVTVYQNPSFDLGASITACQVPFTIDPSLDAGAFLPAGSTYQWKNALGQVTGTAQQLQVNTSDTYTLTVVTPFPEQCTTTEALPVFLFKPVDLGDDIHSCSATILDAEANLPGERIRAEDTDYEWRKNGELLSTQQTLTVLESGEYEITLTRTIAGKACSSIDVIHVEIDLPLAVSLPAEQTICHGETVTLDAGVAADSYVWTRLNSGEQFSGPTLEVSAPGDYRLEVVNGGCSAFVTSTVIVSPAPAVSFSLSAPAGCEGAPLTFTDHSYTDEGTITSRHWEFSDNTTQSDLASVLKSFTTPGTYTVDLTVETDNGCSNSFSQQVQINPNPVAAFSISDACQDASVLLNNTSSPAATLRWNFGDGSGSSEWSPAKSFSGEGVYAVELAAELNGCTAVTSQNITIHPKPQIAFGDQVVTCGSSYVLDAFNTGSSFRWFDPSNGNVTLGTAQQYSVTSDMNIGVEVVNVHGCTSTEETEVVLNSPLIIDLGGDRAVCDGDTLDAGYAPGGQYAWNTSETTRELIVSSSGSYSVVVTDQNGCISNASVNITINQTPLVAALAESVTICSGTSTVLDAGANPSYTYVWSTGETTSSIHASNPGWHSVTVSDANCSAQRSVLVAVVESPLVSFSVDNKCQNEWLSFENTSTSSVGTMQYLWDFDDGTSSAIAEPTKKFGTASVYEVTLIGTAANGCRGEFAIEITVFDLPVAAFSVENACTFNTLAITDLTTSSAVVSNYSWDFGNGQVSSDEMPAYAYPVAGTYHVNLLVTTDQGCSDNFMREVVIGETPSLSSWIPHIETCNASVVLDAGNPGSTYVWTDGSAAQQLTVSAGGEYGVVITSADGCSATAGAEVVMNQPVLPQLADETEDCGTVLLDPVVNAATYLWSTGAQTKTIQVVTSGSYHIQLITPELCISRDTTEVTVNTIPVIELGPAVSACEGETVNVGVSASIDAAYEWNTGATSAVLAVTESGSYTVVLRTPESCTFTDDIEVTMHALPVNSLASEVEACGSVLLDAGNSGSTFNWSTGVTTQTITATASGTYNVTITNVHNCVTEAFTEVTILSVPSFSLGADLTLCHGATATLDPGNVPGTYHWSTNETSRTISAGSNGTYTLSVTNSLGCTGTDDVRVTVRPPLALDLGPDRLLCDNAGQSLSAGIDNVTYTWGSTGGLQSDEKVIHIVQSGTYWVEVVDAFSCVARDSVTVSPTTENITASFLAPSIVGQGDVVHFAQLSEPDPTTFHWTFGDGGFSSQKNPTHRYFQTGDFIATLVVSNGVCTDTLAKTISVRSGRVEIPVTPQLPELVDFLSAASYPNPTKGIVRVEVEMTSETEVVVVMYSIKGVPLDERRKVILKEQFEFDIADESDGIYLVRLIAGGKVRVLKVLKSGGF